MTLSHPFYFAVIGDSHIIDNDYVGPESNPLDSESIYHTSSRLIEARDALNAFHPQLEAVFHIGDYIHDYPSSDWNFYFENSTRLDNAKAITDGFRMPFYVNFGNHDYSTKIARDFTHDLFWEKFRVKPYYSVTKHGWKFIQLNNFLGDTWNPDSEAFNVQLGSLGLEQLDWLEAELAEGQAAFLFIHFPLPAILLKERLDRGLLQVLMKHKRAVRYIFSGHLHRWMEFSARSGLPNLVIGATRYDPRAYVIVEVDTQAGQFRFLNEDDWLWFTHYTVTTSKSPELSESLVDPKRIHRWR